MRKGLSPYEYMYNWKKLDQMSLTEKEDFYSHLNVEDSTDADYMHTK